MGGVEPAVHQPDQRLRRQVHCALRPGPTLHIGPAGRVGEVHGVADRQEQPPGRLGRDQFDSQGPVRASAGPLGHGAEVVEEQAGGVRSDRRGLARPSPRHPTYGRRVRRPASGRVRQHPPPYRITKGAGRPGCRVEALETFHQSPVGIEAVPGLAVRWTPVPGVPDRGERSLDQALPCPPIQLRGTRRKSRPRCRGARAPEQPSTRGNRKDR